jgi:hypothetical protein
MTCYIQIRRTTLFGLVVVSAGDTKGDTVLAGGRWVVCVLPCTSDLAGSASVATWDRRTLRQAVVSRKKQRTLRLASGKIERIVSSESQVCHGGGGRKDGPGWLCYDALGPAHALGKRLRIAARCAGKQIG